MEPATSQRHVERLWAPIGWWLLVAGVAATFGWVLVVAIPTPIALAIMVAVFALGAFGLVRGGAVTVTAAPGEFRVGSAHLGGADLGEVTVLTTEQWRTALTQAGADQMFLFTRPWLNCGVKIEVADPNDPNQYWLVTCRHPKLVAQAIGHTGNASTTERTVDGSQEK